LSCKADKRLFITVASTPVMMAMAQGCIRVTF
jgi:hypothetical protein